MKDILLHLTEEVSENIRQLADSAGHTIESYIAEVLETHVILDERKKARGGRPRGKFGTRIVSPTGEIMEMGNVSVFCDEQVLNRHMLYRVLRGTRNHHKGWTLPK